MDLVINISECIYRAKQRLVANQKRMIDEVDIAIANGTPLPKGHGDIVDIETLIDMFWDGNSMEITKYDLSVIDPIIEADKENKKDEHMTADELAELFTESEE